MTTADWALIISLGSLAISLAGFVWSVWSKFIYPKPRVQTSFSIMSTFGEGWENSPDAICISATNHGPQQVTLHSAVARKKPPLLRKRSAEMGILNPYKGFPYDLQSDGPFSGGLPKKLDVGEQFSVYFPVVKDWFDDGLEDFGFQDTFGRYHWVPRKSVSEVRERGLKDGISYKNED